MSVGVAPRQETGRTAAVPSPSASRRTTTSTTASAARDASADAIPLGALLQQAGEALQRGLPHAVWVVAAVSAVKAARGGASVELVEPDVTGAHAGILRTYMPDTLVACLRQRTGLAVDATDLVGMTVTLRLSLELHPRWGVSGRIQALAPGIETSLAKSTLEATIARLRREALWDRQLQLPSPRDVTRVVLVHPPAAAGFSDVAADLARWAAAGLIMVRSIPTPFEGSGAAAGLVEALRRAAEPMGGHKPDVVVLIRGGGAAASLVALDGEAVARAVVALPIPLIAGLGHATDRTLVDRLAWLSVDTPSKALGALRDMMSAPARQARTAYAAVLAAVSAGLDREEPRLAAAGRLVAAEALRQATAASVSLERSWSIVVGATDLARERLGRVGDDVDRLSGDIAAASPALVERTASELGAVMEAIRTRARRATKTADDGARALAFVTARVAACVAAADAELAGIGRSIPVAAATRADRAAAEAQALSTTVETRARNRLDQADDGARHLASVVGTVAETCRRQEVEVGRLHQAVETAAAHRLEQVAAALARDVAALDAADPATVLHRGFALVTDPSGRPVTSVVAAAAAETILIRFADGILAVRPIQHDPIQSGDTP